jgi:hypothetical protein
MLNLPPDTCHFNKFPSVSPLDYQEYSDLCAKDALDKYRFFRSSIDLGYDRFGDYCQTTDLGRAALVYRPKSQMRPSRAKRERDYRKVDYFHVFKNTTVFRRRAKSFPSKAILGNRSNIYSFSENSKRNLKHKIANSEVDFTSQFCLTFHQEWPMDGKELKRLLNSWLTICRKYVLNLKYIWILEFQRRSAPHFHVFMNQGVSDSLRYFLSLSWCRLTNKGLSDPDIEKTTQFRFHDHSSNFITWDMGSGSYLCKYLDKEQQKNVPEQFENVGRFWGSSRGTVAPPIILCCASLDQNTLTSEQEQASVKITRILGKLHERRLEIIGKSTGKTIKSKIRTTGQSSTGNYLSTEFKRLVSRYIGRDTTMQPKLLELHTRINLRTNL